MNGHLKARTSTIKDLKKTMRKEEVIEKVETIKGTQRNFILLDLVDNSKQNNSQVIEEWLRNDEFSYFEIDTQVSFV